MKHGAEDEGVLIRLVRGAAISVRQKCIYTILAGMREDLARPIAEREPIDTVHREPLLNAARSAVDVLEATASSSPPRSAHRSLMCNRAADGAVDGWNRQPVSRPQSQPGIDHVDPKLAASL